MVMRRHGLRGGPQAERWLRCSQAAQADSAAAKVEADGFRLAFIMSRKSCSACIGRPPRSAAATCTAAPNNLEKRESHFINPARSVSLMGVAVTSSKTSHHKAPLRVVAKLAEGSGCAPGHQRPPESARRRVPPCLAGSAAPCRSAGDTYRRLPEISPQKAKQLRFYKARHPKSRILQRGRRTPVNSCQPQAAVPPRIATTTPCANNGASFSRSTSLHVRGRSRRATGGAVGGPGRSWQRQRRGRWRWWRSARHCPPACARTPGPPPPAAPPARRHL